MTLTNRELFPTSDGNIHSETIQKDAVRRIIGESGAPDDIGIRINASNIRRKIPGPVTLIRDESSFTVKEKSEIKAQELVIEQAKTELANQIRRRAGARSDSVRANLDRNIAGLTKNLEILEGQLAGLKTITINGLDIVVDENTSQVKDNPLNCFTDVQYHISLTMLSQQKTLLFQTEGFNQEGDTIDIDTLKKVQRLDQSVTLASTGEVFRNVTTTSPSSISFVTRDNIRAPARTIDAPDAESIISPRNYYNIISMTTKNIMEPSLNNPMVSNMLSIKLKIAEPYGFKLDEDIRNLALSLGYENINLGRIHYRVDVFFSGYNQDTGEWVEQIDISAGKGIKIISNIMIITGFDAEITPTGTVYNIDMAPSGHFAYRPEDFVLDVTTMDTSTTFRGFLTNLSKALKKNKHERTQKRIIRNYEFFAPSMLMDAAFDVDEFVQQSRSIFRGADERHIASTGKDIDILTILRGAISNTIVGQELMIADINNERFTTPRIHFTVRFNTIFGDSNGAQTIDNQLHDYKEITHQYIIEPYITFKHGTVTELTMNEYVAPDSQLARIKEMIRFGMLRRIYNYMYTSENTEVIDFAVKLRAFYYESLNTTAQAAGSGQQGFAGSASQAQTDQVTSRDLFQVSGDSASDANVDDAVRRIFGDLRTDTAVGDGGNTRRGSGRLGGGFNESPDARFFGDTASPPSGRRSDYETYLNDYLAFDLLKLDGLQVRGDPVWLLGPYGNLDINSLQKITASEGVGIGIKQDPGLQVRPRTGQVIFLKLFPPVQDDYMNPNRSHGSSHPNIIGGFYQILSVTSTFENGRFTQSIEGAKMSHLNYAEELFERSAANRQFSGPSPRPGDIHREPINYGPPRPRAVEEVVEEVPTGPLITGSAGVIPNPVFAVIRNLFGGSE